MKKISILGLLVIAINSFGQTFELPIYFEDSNQNRDTIYIGYDDLATDGIDEEFNEVNIIDEPIDTVFEIRISDEKCVGNTIDGLGDATYHAKRQILKNYRNKILNIVIKSSDLPVKMSWDSLHLNSNVENGALITDTNPGGWFDVAGHSDLGFVFMSKFNEVSFNPENEIISLWFIFGIDTIVNTKEVKESDIGLNVFPNPTSNTININTDFSELFIYDANGRLINKYKKGDYIDLSNYNAGNYFMRIHNNKYSTTKKISVIK